MNALVRKLRSIVAVIIVGSASILPSCAGMGGGGGGMHYLIDPSVTTGHPAPGVGT